MINRTYFIAYFAVIDSDEIKQEITGSKVFTVSSLFPENPEKIIDEILRIIKEEKGHKSLTATAFNRI